MAEICVLSEPDFWQPAKYLAKYLGMNIGERRERIKEFIDDQLPEFKKRWKTINDKIGSANAERKKISHGIVGYLHTEESILVHINKGRNEIQSHRISTKEIDKLIQELYELNTGDEGLNGHFAIEVTTARIDKWNEKANDDYKVIHRVNGKVLSKWGQKKSIY